MVEPESTVETPAPGADQLTGIYEEHARFIYYLALRMLGDPAQAEDVTHDVFIKAFRKMDEFRGQSCLRTWLYRIALNHCHNILASWRHRNIQCSGDHIPEVGWSEAGNPLRVLETKELGQRIQKALDTLPEEYRLLLLLVADENLSYEDMGVLTNQTADAVRGKLHRARKAFAVVFSKTA